MGQGMLDQVGDGLGPQFLVARMMALLAILAVNVLPPASASGP
jgi:hypothetical protein